MRLYDVISFDCYGTLIDWEGGIFEAFAAEAERLECRVDRQALLEIYHRVEPEVERAPYRRYREVLTLTAARVAKELGWPSDSGRAAFLADRLSSWPPFPDTVPSLKRLASGGVKLGILSNVDDDLLDATRRRMAGLSFDLIVTAEQVRSYKPAHAHFTTARAKLPQNARWLHAAQSYFHDVVPCKELGIPVAWINRKGEPAGAAGAADREFRDLSELTDWLAPEA